jgi:cysteinyl-tRNA synthetase
MKLYNTLTKQKDKLKPLKNGHITMYSCGPTVYGRVHIGNLRAFITADLLRRTLKHGDTDVKAVMNITDVDDKTIALLKTKHGDLKSELHKITEPLYREFAVDAEAVGVDLDAFDIQRATDPKNIAAMQDLIRELVAKNIAYVSDGSVYFSITAYEKAGYKYGVLSNVHFDPKERIDNDEYDKESARDFVLWKGYKEGEPSWDFELNGHQLPGRPGWHIECSAMSTQELGQPFDIHTGGIDLIFPHHENEIAQSRGANGKQLANYFVHNNHVLVEGEKMSKSLGNVFTLADIEKRNIDASAFRLMILQAHYTSELNFSWQDLEAKQEFLHKLRAWADRQFEPESDINNDSLEADLDVLRQRFDEAIYDDLSTPKALAEISQFIDNIDQKGISAADRKPFAATLDYIDEVLALGLSSRDDLEDKQKELLEKRGQLRLEKKFAEADEIRDLLRKQGIEIEDTTYGVRWSRI